MKKQSLFSRVVAISAIVVALPILGSVVETVVRLRPVPDKVDRIERNQAKMAAALNIDLSEKSAPTSNHLGVFMAEAIIPKKQ